MIRLYYIKLLWIILLISWAVLLFSIGLIPDAGEIITQSISKFRWDHLEHFVGYFMLGFFFVMWRGDHSFHIQAIDFILFIAIGSIFGWLAEFLQIFIPGRSFTIADMVYNYLGMLSGAGLGYFLLIRIIIRKSIKTS